MPEKILHIKGSACPYAEAKIAAETTDVDEEIRALESAGHEVIRIGNPTVGFTLGEVGRAFQMNPDIVTVIVDAHGNINRDRHFLRSREKKSADPRQGRIWASDFYAKLATYADGKPLNIFMFSCGSGMGCTEAVEKLPKGSTLVNFTEEEKVSSFGVEPESLAVKYSDKNFAEQLFLSILCRGFSKNIPYLPQISVSADGEALNNVWSMWDIVRGSAGGDSEEPFFPRKAKRELAPFLTAKQVSHSIAASNLYMKALGETYGTAKKDITYRSRRTPVTVGLKLDVESFMKSAAEQELLGPMCAVGYISCRDDIGAFQAERLRQAAAQLPGKHLQQASSAAVSVPR